MNIKELREKLGLSQMALASKIGVALMSVRLWENNAGKPNEENLKKLKAFFGEELTVGE